MKKEDFIVVCLLILLAMTQWFWIRAEKRTSYLEGRASVFAEMSAQDDGIGTCYDKKGKC